VTAVALITAAIMGGMVLGVGFSHHVKMKNQPSDLT
jgi:hypothetical protein